MKISSGDPEKLLAEIGDGIFTLKGRGVYYPFDQFQYRATGINSDGNIALEIVSNSAETRK